jgi:hypothetical protein
VVHARARTAATAARAGSTRTLASVTGRLSKVPYVEVVGDGLVDGLVGAGASELLDAVVLNPNAFSASVPAFHDVSSHAVLTPLNVRVSGQFVLRSTRGVVDSEANVVSCSYTDPAGLFVEITGVLTGR